MPFREKNILVIGDAILDEYISGSVSRISPEAPIPILEYKTTEYRLGGCLNVARNLVSLGANVWVICRIGDDKAGGLIIQELSQAGINIDLLLRDPSLPTTVKTRFVAGGHHMLRMDNENKAPLSLESVKTVSEDLSRHWRYFDGVIVSDYCKGLVSKELLEEIRLIQEREPKTLIGDTHSKHLMDFRGFTCLTPNKKEFSQLFPGVVVYENSSIQTVLEQYRIDHLLVTLSEDGMLLCMKEQSTIIPAQHTNVVDITGCGDTVIATYTLALTSGYSCIDAAYLANKAAGIVAKKYGTATVTLKELF